MSNKKLSDNTTPSMRSIKAPVRVISSNKTWMETDALDQLHRVAELPGMRAAFGLPDLHPGKGQPIGAAFVSDVIYPHLVGSDIGCGMGLWQLDLPAQKINLSQWERKLTGLDEEWDGDTIGWLEKHGIDAGCESSNQAEGFHAKLGTIGGGNHFAEVQTVQQVFNAAKLADTGLDARRVVLLVHSGSRGLGQAILSDYLADYGAVGISPVPSDVRPHTVDYLARHDFADAWAVANRALISHRISEALRVNGRSVLDVSHNHVRPLAEEEVQHMKLNPDADKPLWIHRKGATPANEGMVMIPGSRGSLSYLVRPMENNPLALALAGFSLAHGAGRKWRRSDCKGRLVKRYSVKDLERNDYGGRVLCKQKGLLYEEAPQAYKCIDQVISDLVAFGLIELIASFKPVLTYKTMRTS